MFYICECLKMTYKTKEIIVLYFCRFFLNMVSFSTFQVSVSNIYTLKTSRNVF